MPPPLATDAIVTVLERHGRAIAEKRGRRPHVVLASVPRLHDETRRSSRGGRQASVSPSTARSAPGE